MAWPDRPGVRPDRSGWTPGLTGRLAFGSPARDPGVTLISNDAAENKACQSTYSIYMYIYILYIYIYGTVHDKMSLRIYI